MSVTATLDLFVDSNNVPSPYYWLDVLIPISSNYEGIGHSAPPTTTSPVNQFHVDVNVDTASGSTDTTVQVLLGELTVDVQNDEVHVHLKDGGGNGVGEGVIAVADAKESARPIDPSDIS